jgi:hypothetical protein
VPDTLAIAPDKPAAVDVERVSLTVSGRKLVAARFAAGHDGDREFVTRLPDARFRLSQTLRQILLGDYLGPLPTDRSVGPLPSKGTP